MKRIHRIVNNLAAAYKRFESTDPDKSMKVYWKIAELYFHSIKRKADWLHVETGYDQCVYESDLIDALLNSLKHWDPNGKASFSTFWINGRNQAGLNSTKKQRNYYKRIDSLVHTHAVKDSQKDNGHDLSETKRELTVDFADDVIDEIDKRNFNKEVSYILKRVSRTYPKLKPIIEAYVIHGAKSPADVSRITGISTSTISDRMRKMFPKVFSQEEITLIFNSLSIK